MTDQQQTLEIRFQRLESLVEQIALAMIATTETVERMATRIDTLAVSVQHQNHQVQQQGYQIFALSDSLQALIDHQVESQEQLNQLTATLHHLVTTLETH